MDVGIELLTQLCVALGAADDEIRASTQWVELFSSRSTSPEAARELAIVEAAIHDHPTVSQARFELESVVRENPDRALRLVVAEVRRVETEQAKFVTDYSDVLVAISSIDTSWRRIIVDLARVEPAMWSSICFAFGDAVGRLIVDQIGIEGLARAWIEYERASEDEQLSLGWAWDIVFNVEDWADEQTHRLLLVRLVDLADDDTIWDVAAGPLEEFVADKKGRLEWVEQQAAVSAKFVKALSGVWTHGKDAITNARVRAITPVQ